jgi:hypothetical protein
MFHNVSTAMKTYLEGLGYLDSNPNEPIITPASTSTPKLFSEGRVGMPELIPDWDGPGFIVDIIAPDELAFYDGRNISESKYPLIITVITQGLTSSAAILCQKVGWLTLKATNANRRLGLDDVLLSPPDKGQGMIRFGIMPQERLSWNTKNQPKMCFSGQIFWWVEENDDSEVLTTEP